MPQRSSAALLSTLRTLAALVLLAPAFLAVQAQLGNSPAAAGTPRVSLPGENRDNDPFREDPVLRDRLEKSRATDRQRRIVDDANRLVSLTAQYRKSLEAHGTPTDEDQKLLAQIEKLARDVKDRMRGM